MTAFRRFFGRPPRRRVVVMLAAAGSVPLVAGAVALGWWQVALVVVAVLQVAAVILLVDMRGHALADVRARMASSKEVREVSRTLKQADRRVDNFGTRLLSSLETSRLEVAERITEVRDEVAERMTEVRDDAAKGEKHLVDSALPRQARQVEALHQLYNRVRPRKTMPLAGGWALDPTAILALMELVEARRPDLVLELGSGTSSVWLGYALEQLGSGHLVSIDHDEHYAGMTREHVRRHGLEELVEVRIAPLTDAGLPDHETLWYEPSAFDDLPDIDLLVVDGPPKAIGQHARYPALPKLNANLSGNAALAIDDANRPDEKHMLRRWGEEFPEMREISPPTDSSLRLLTRDAVEKGQAG